MLYDLQQTGVSERLYLTHKETKYTGFKAALDRIVTAEAGSVEQFIGYLQRSLDQKKIDTRIDDINPPDGPLLADSPNE